jgi:hypothetical protein
MHDPSLGDRSRSAAGERTPVGFIAAGMRAWRSEATRYPEAVERQRRGAGLAIEAIAEPFADEETAAAHPRVADTRIAPYFLIVRARKP